MANSVKVAGVMMWANLNKKNEMSDKYQFELCNLSKAAAAAIEDLGLSTNTSDKYPEKGTYITIKSNYEIKAFDTEGKQVMDAVGNGSKAQVVVGFYDWKFKNKAGRSPSCMKLIITDLVVYGGKEESVEDEDEAL